MELLFENACTHTEDFVNEVYQYLFFKRKPLIVCYVLLAISLIVGLLTQNWSVILLVFMTVLFVITAYARNRKVTIGRNEEVSQSPISVTMVVTDGYVQPSTSLGSVYKIYFRDIKLAAQTKNYILLTTKAVQILAFRKDGFTKGTPEEFIAFLRTKGLKI